MKPFWLSLVLLSIGCLTVKAQLLPFRSELNVHGWAIPEIQKLKAKSVSEQTADGGVIKKRQFDIEKLKPSILIWKDSGVEHHCEFGNLQAYSFNDKVFAVGGGCVIFLISIQRFKKGTIRSKSYMAAYTRYTFYDENGDGKFERRYNSSGGDFEIRIPDWAKE